MLEWCYSILSHPTLGSVFTRGKSLPAMTSCHDICWHHDAARGKSLHLSPSLLSPESIPMLSSSLRFFPEYIFFFPTAEKQWKLFLNAGAGPGEKHRNSTGRSSRTSAPELLYTEDDKARRSGTGPEPPVPGRGGRGARGQRAAAARGRPGAAPRSLPLGAGTSPRPGGCGDPGRGELPLLAGQRALPKQKNEKMKKKNKGKNRGINLFK